MGEYWKRRQNLIYYRVLFQIVSVVGRDATSLIDIGSGNTDYITWFDWIPEKVQLNKGFGRSGDKGDIKRISADFYNWTPDRVYDVALLLQVLEHVSDPKLFCDQLKKTAKRLVISVPYKWGAGRTPGHIQDPVDEKKLKGWMGLKPNYSMCIREPFGPARLIAYYDIEGGERTRISREYAKEAIAEKAPSF